LLAGRNLRPARQGGQKGVKNTAVDIANPHAGPNLDSPPLGSPPAAALDSPPLLDLLPAQLLAEVLGHVPHGHRGPARQACRALREAACQAARCLRVVCLSHGADGQALEQHAAAVLRALRERPHLEELVLDRAVDFYGANDALPYLRALGQRHSGSGTEGQPPCPAVKSLTVRARWGLGQPVVAALGAALRPGGALSRVRTLELGWRGVLEEEGFSQLPHALPPGLRVSAGDGTQLGLQAYVTDEYRSGMAKACSGIAAWALAERGAGGPSPHGQLPAAAGAGWQAAAQGPLAGQGGAPLLDMGARPSHRPATAQLVKLQLNNLVLSPDLAYTLAQLPSLESVAVQGCGYEHGRLLSRSVQEFEKAVAHLARCPALRELRLVGDGYNRRLLGDRQPLWAWSAQALLGPGVRCEIEGGAGSLVALRWPTTDGEATEEEVLACVRHMAGCGRPPTGVTLGGGCPNGTPWLGGRPWGGHLGRDPGLGRPWEFQGAPTP
jgi:hypothetical protein